MRIQVFKYNNNGDQNLVEGFKPDSIFAYLHTFAYFVISRLGLLKALICLSSWVKLFYFVLVSAMSKNISCCLDIASVVKSLSNGTFRTYWDVEAKDLW